jgi:hypothetical protein
MGIRSSVALAISKEFNNFSKNVLENVINHADDVKEYKNDDVGEYVLYVFDWVKWYDDYSEIKELYRYLDSLPTNNEHEQYQLVVYTNDDFCEIIEKGYYGFGLSVGIQHNP